MNDIFRTIIMARKWLTTAAIFSLRMTWLFPIQHRHGKGVVHDRGNLIFYQQDRFSRYSIVIAMAYFTTTAILSFTNKIASPDPESVSQKTNKTVDDSSLKNRIAFPKYSI